MTLIPTKCIKHHDTRKRCTVSENGKTYTLENESGYRIKLIAVDKCITQGVGDKRCDYLFNVNNEKLKQAIFVELKGGALVDALRQIYDSMIYLREEFKGYQLDARIVGSKDVPGFNNIPERARLEKVVRLTGGRLQRATNKIYIEKI